jgi:glutathione peroxidase
MSFNKLNSIVLLVVLALLSNALGSDKNKEESLSSNIEKISVKDIDGKEVKLSDYKGKVLLIVNVASYCGFTKQYAGLEEIYKNYKNEEFEILAFPCNQFGNQEPGTNEEIKNFCSSKFDVSFRLFDKIDVNGKNKSPLYAILTDNDITGKGDIKWNFEKFLIDKKGNVIARFPSSVEPTSNELISAIEKVLSK